MKSVFLLVFLLLILILTLGGLYYYFAVFRKRDLFPDIDPNINVERLESMNFKKISYQGESSFYVPNKWVLLDKNTNSYGDVLSGSLAYLKAYPNSLGILSDQVCKELSVQISKKFKNEGLYTSSDLISSGIYKQKNYSGCLLEYDSLIAEKEYRVRQFYVFQKYNIYQLFIQTRKHMDSEQEISNVILDSISLAD